MEKKRNGYAQCCEHGKVGFRFLGWRIIFLEIHQSGSSPQLFGGTFSGFSEHTPPIFFGGWWLKNNGLLTRATCCMGVWHAVKNTNDFLWFFLSEFEAFEIGKKTVEGRRFRAHVRHRIFIGGTRGVCANGRWDNTLPSLPSLPSGGARTHTLDRQKPADSTNFFDPQIMEINEN